MANRTVKDAHSIKGTNPQYLIEKITRSRIYESRYWKEQCFALTAELLVDKAMELRYIGGVFGGNIKPTPFLCLILKMLQIQPEKDIVVEFISQQDCKYVRALGAMYMRLTGSSIDCYKYLEPLYLDYRKLRRMNKTGGFELVHMDEFIDEIIREDRICDVILPRIQKRHVLEEGNELPSKDNYLEDDMEDVESSSDEEEGEYRGVRDRSTSPAGRTRDWDKPRRSPSPRFRRSRSRSRSPHRRREREERHRGDRDRDRDRRDRKHRDSERDKERDKGRDKERDKDRDKDRSSKKDKHRSHRHDDEEERSRHHHKSKKNKKDKDEKKSKSSSSGSANVDAEIAEANALRAQLGLPPLK